jgi:hypothetical protein
LISIFTKETERVDVYNNAGFGWGWNPFSGWGMGFSNVYSSTPEGTLLIDIIDAKTKELVWQGRRKWLSYQRCQRKKMLE